MSWKSFSLSLSAVQKSDSTLLYARAELEREINRLEWKRIFHVGRILRISRLRDRVIYIPVDLYYLYIKKKSHVPFST